MLYRKPRLRCFFRWISNRIIYYNNVKQQSNDIGNWSLFVHN